MKAKAPPSAEAIVHGAAENMAALWEIPLSLMGRRATRNASLGISLVDGTSPAPLVNNATLLRKPPPDATAAVAEAVIQFFNEGQGGAFSINSHWPEVDFAPFGYRNFERNPVMYRAPAGSAPDAPEELEITRVRDAASLEAYEYAFLTGFGIESLLPPQPGNLFDTRVLVDQRFRLWVGKVDGHPVASAAACVTGAVVGVYNIATLQNMRGRGYGHAMTWTAMSSAPDLPSVLQASAEGYNLYKRLGYLDVGTFTFWRHHRATPDETA